VRATAKTGVNIATGSPQGAEDDAGIEIDVGIELALDEVIVRKNDALQLHLRPASITATS